MIQKFLQKLYNKRKHKMFTEKISQEKVNQVRAALEIVTGSKTDLSNIELKAIIYYGNKLVEKGKTNG
tara:strand:+ start:2022 stop:2225 length:204 start_codon:yes stop_codon:yes gene_type:complete